MSRNHAALAGSELLMARQMIYARASLPRSCHPVGAGLFACLGRQFGHTLDVR